MKEFLKWFGLLNEKGEPSGHKYTSFAATIMIAYVHYKGLNKETATTFLVVDWLMVMLLLGRVTFSQILELKNGEKKQTPTE